MCIRQDGPLWGEAQFIAYKYVPLLLDIIQRPKSHSNMVSAYPKP
jgi:hypothetical protein